MVLPELGLRALIGYRTGQIMRSTANTPKSGEVTLFGSNSEAIGAYKYLALFCMKG